MIVGVDFDNTIVCYDQVFHQAALEQGLISAELPLGKERIRDDLRNRGMEEAWIELQGYVYGARMQDAPPFPGVIEFFACCRDQGIDVRIISHKTRYPFRGPRYDLHQAALTWLDLYGFNDPLRLGLSSNRIYFELTKVEKLNRIGQVGCSHFVDDLPEFLAEATFPPNVEPILFAPGGKAQAAEHSYRSGSWPEIQELIIGSSLGKSLR